MAKLEIACFSETTLDHIDQINTSLLIATAGVVYGAGPHEITRDMITLEHRHVDEQGSLSDGFVEATVFVEENELPGRFRYQQKITNIAERIRHSVMEMPVGEVLSYEVEDDVPVCGLIVWGRTVKYSGWPHKGSAQPALVRSADGSYRLNNWSINNEA